MLSSPFGVTNPFIAINSRTYKCQRLVPPLTSTRFRLRPILCSSLNNHHNTIDKPSKPNKVNLVGPTSTTQGEVSPMRWQRSSNGCKERKGFGQVGSRQMLVICGLGYWVQGFRCFPWLALNFQLAHTLNLNPSTLQLVQNSGNLPMVAKPLHGILSDSVYIGGAHRIPYILIGVLLQVMSWGPLALIPVARGALPALMGYILLGNLGASITEVARDALVAEYGQRQRMGGLQSYAFMASAAGGIFGNLLGGFSLAAVPPKTIFLVFAGLLSLKFAILSAAREDSLGLSPPSDHHLARRSILGNIKIQLNDLKKALSDERISRPLSWLVASVAMVPLLSGSVFCYQTQCLHLDPSIIGMSRVISQSALLTLAALYARFLKEIPMRQLVGTVQILYAFSLLLDFVLVRQINLRIGISNEVFALCFSGFAETFAQFKLLPFSALLASLCPQGCEGSLTSFIASALCLSSIFSGFLGVGLASLMGITSKNYSALPVGILMKFVAALLPLCCILHVPTSPSDSSDTLTAMLLNHWESELGPICFYIASALSNPSSSSN